MYIIIREVRSFDQVQATWYFTGGMRKEWTKNKAGAHAYAKFAGAETDAAILARKYRGNIYVKEV